MKSIYFLFLIFGAQTALAQSWMENFVVELQEQGIEINNQEDLNRYLQQKKKSKNNSSENDPLFQQLQSLSKSSKRPIQINIIKKAYFNQKEAERKPSSKEVIKSDFFKPEWLELQSQFFYSRIEATDSATGGALRTSSKLNMGLLAAYKREVNSSINLHFKFGGNFIGFETPSGANLEGESDVYFQGAGQLSWQIDSFFSARGEIGVRQLPYLTAFGTQVAVDQATHPYFGAHLDLHLLPVTKRDWRVGVYTQVLNSSIEGDVSATSGVVLGLQSQYYFKFKNYRPHLSLWYNSYSQQTSNTEQSMSDIGLSFGFELNL